MIRALLFDIGNVLVRFDFSKALRAIATMTSVTDEAEILHRIDAVKQTYEDGGIDRAGFLGDVFEFLQYRGTEAQFIAAWQGIFTANAPMVTLVKEVHGRFPLYLLSNTNCMHVEGLFRDFGFLALFSGGTYSHVARASKPHPEIFRIACGEHGLIPEETFFIDDLAPNVESARALGFVAHQYDHDRHPDLLEALTVAGV